MSALWGPLDLTTITGAPSWGLAPYTFVIASGTPPPGITLSDAGILSGTPTTAGYYEFTVRATDATGEGFRDVDTSILILPYYFVDLTAVANAPAFGLAPYDFALAPGSAALPPGLAFSGSHNHVIDGWPTTAGVYPITIRATDATGEAHVDVDTSITITGAPSITGFAVPDGQVDVDYTPTTLTASGGAGAPWTWAFLGTPPPGLSIDPATGEITGIPLTAGAYAWQAKVTDAEGAVAVHGLVCAIVAALAFTADTADDTLRWRNYWWLPLVDGAQGGCRFSLASGSLPPGMSLDEDTGLVYGNCDTPGTYAFTLQVDDGV